VSPAGIASRTIGMRRGGPLTRHARPVIFHVREGRPTLKELTMFVPPPAFFS
jgi:hypothetical protein